MFGGIGACSKALERLRIDYEIADYVEIDKYAVASFNAMHNTNFEPQDIKKWDKNIEVDIITHGSPCQDFSIAGLQLGASRGGQTRSSLMYETVRIVKKLKPQYVIWENVPNVLSKKHIHNFQNYIQFLDNLGYKSAYEVLNAKDYGIPQNRERLFVVSVLNGRTRDLLGLELDFDFPQPIQLKLKLKDMLENDVDEKFYLSDKVQQRLKITDETFTKNIVGTTKPDFRTIGQRVLVYQQDSIMGALVATDYKQPKQILEPQIQKVDIPQTVTVRKYEVDIEKLKKVLRTHKNLTNKEIAERLDRPITLVEHWFRKDKSFSIPDADVWFKLKELLNITTNEFDLPITEFIEQDGVYEKANRCYITTGISPTLTSASADEKILENSCLLVSEATKKGYALAHEGDGVYINRPHQKRGVVQKDKIQTLKTSVDDVGVVIGTYQHSKSDNFMKGKDRLQLGKETSDTIQTTPKEGIAYSNLRIRKLTPKECWRLMGFDDEDFDKAAQVNSKTQLYKQAGNSIVVNVLEAIFKELFKL